MTGQLGRRLTSRYFEPWVKVSQDFPRLWHDMSVDTHGILFFTTIFAGVIVIQ
jgi:hypothetical protein